MATKKMDSDANGHGKHARVSTDVEQLLLAAQERDDQSLETGRRIITFREGAFDQGLKSMKAKNMKISDARDFTDQTAALEAAGDADAFVFPEIGCALVGGEASQQYSIDAVEEQDAEGPIQCVEPEYFVFAEGNEYLRGFSSAVNAIMTDIGDQQTNVDEDETVSPEVLGVTWGVSACRVPSSRYSGTGIKVAILDTGFDLGHPDFRGRPVISRTFVGQPVQDGNGHGTHVVGTALGPIAPAGRIPRYGIAFNGRIHVGKVLTNAGSGTTATVLAGMNWAIANRCEVISMSLGARSPVQVAYTNAGNAALRNGLLMIAAAGNDATNTGSPANSPSIMAVASLDSTLRPSSFSNFNKIEIAAPGRDVFSAWPRPVLYRTISGTSMATPHVAGCAALWAQTNPAFRGRNLWLRLQNTARRLPFPASRVGAGLVQAPQ